MPILDRSLALMNLKAKEWQSVHYRLYQTPPLSTGAGLLLIEGWGL
jgi:hypothetical protein